MKAGKIIGAIIALLVVIGIIVLAVKLISGAFSLLGGLIDAVLGLAVVVALVAIVIWMFRYAAKSKK
ncbi:MAG: hypothetical protein DBX49_01665 [Clostridia bacterium]|nr:MAG: hypothetical protein DBX49_01665 [Clostridia bacterium]